MNPAATPTPLPPDCLAGGFPDPIVESAPLTTGLRASRTLALFIPRESQERLGIHRFREKYFMTDDWPALLDRIVSDERPFVLLHPDSIKGVSRDVTRQMEVLPSRPVVGLIESMEAMDAALGVALSFGFSCIFPEDCLEHFDELSRAAGWMEAGGPPLGLEAHLMEGGADIRAITIEKRSDKAAAVEEVLRFAKRIRPERNSATARFLFDLRLVLEEAINNAIFHAFLDLRDREKYTVESFSKVEPTERIEISYGSDGRTFAVAVTDNQGRLTRETVLSKIQRQLSTEGLMDQSGRGLYLIYSLAGRTVFNLSSDRLSQVVALFPVSPDAWPDASQGRPMLVFSRA